MDSNYIRWNMPNWITVFLMAILGYALLSTAVSFVKGKVSA